AIHPVHPHSQVDHNQVWIGGQVNGLSIDVGRHSKSNLRCPAVDVDGVRYTQRRSKRNRTRPVTRPIALARTNSPPVVSVVPNTWGSPRAAPLMARVAVIRSPPWRRWRSRAAGPRTPKVMWRLAAELITVVVSVAPMLAGKAGIPAERSSTNSTA